MRTSKNDKVDISNLMLAVCCRATKEHNFATCRTNYQASRYRPISPCEERLYPRRNGTFEKTRSGTISHNKGS